MNKTGLEYLRYRLEIAKECEADLVKIDIEELASALCEVDRIRNEEREKIIESLLPSDKMIVNRDDFTEDLINQGYNKALREVIEVMSMDIADCNTCPLGCEHRTYGECEEKLRRYVLEQIKE